MSGRGESVFAVLTPPGRGGIAVIRCVGPGAEAALARCFRPAARGKKLSQNEGCHPQTKFGGAVSTSHSTPKQHRLGVAPESGSFEIVSKTLPDAGAILYGHVVDAEDRPLDEILLCRTAAQEFEVNCHGGPAAVEAVGGRLESLGLARVDADRLLEVEGIAPVEREARRALRRATTPLAARILLDQLNGAMARAVTEIEAGLAATGKGVRSLKSLGLLTPSAAIDVLLEHWNTCGRFLARPPRVAIAGLPNSGKSTLLNRLVGADRVITSPVPGTTRDTVEVEAALPALSTQGGPASGGGGPAWGGAGLPVVLVDTAGLRAACGEVEREGVARARAELAQADLVVYLLDTAAGRRPEDDAALGALGERALAVWNKADAVEAARPDETGRRPRHGSWPCQGGTLRISALTGEGVEALAAAILARLGYAPAAPGEAVPFTAEQAKALKAARKALAAGRAADAARAVAALLG